MQEAHGGQTDAALAPIQNKREELLKDPDHVREVFRRGAMKAQAIARQTLEEAKKAMKIK